MYKLSTYLVVIYFLTYLPIYETSFIPNWLPRWNHTLTHLRFIHNWITTGIQWMVCWWVLVHCCSMLSPLSGSFACLDFGPCSLFLFLTCSWVLSFYKVWLGFIILTFVWVVTPIQFSRLIENESLVKTAVQKSPCNGPQGPTSAWLLGPGLVTLQCSHQCCVVVSFFL